MVVLDASALVDWLLKAPAGVAVSDHMREARAPQTLDFAQLEVISALRAQVARGEVRPGRADVALEDLQATPIRYHRVAPLGQRVWSLRDVLTPYDAAYVALAEVLDAPLLTADRRLARSRGHRATIVEAPRGLRPQ